MINRNRMFSVILLCVLLSTSSLVTEMYRYHDGVSDNYEEWLEAGERTQVRLNAFDYDGQINDKLLTIDAYYQNALTHTMVTDFFVRLTGSERIALPIIYHAEQNDVPLALMFSVAWVESKYKPYALNHNPTSIDRGLFQLNSLSFRFLDLEDFFNPEINAFHAGRYLRYCLDKGAEDISTALAIYNAGLGRVRRDAIPASTKVYVGRVLEYRTQLIRRFNSFISQQVNIAQNTGQL